MLVQEVECASALFSANKSIYKGRIETMYVIKYYFLCIKRLFNVTQFFALWYVPDKLMIYKF